MTTETEIVVRAGATSPTVVIVVTTVLGEEGKRAEYVLPSGKEITLLLQPNQSLLVSESQAQVIG